MPDVLVHYEEKSRPVLIEAVTSHGPMSPKRRGRLSEVFQSRGIDSKMSTEHHKSPDAQSHWYRRQIVDSAHKAGHYADFNRSVSWSRIRIEIENIVVDFVASLHGAGREPGVGAVTTFGELSIPEGEARKDAMSGSVFDTTNDAFSFLYSERVEEIEKRSADLEALLDKGLAVALTELMREI